MICRFIFALSVAVLAACSQSQQQQQASAVVLSSDVVPQSVTTSENVSSPSRVQRPQSRATSSSSRLVRRSNRDVSSARPSAPRELPARSWEAVPASSGRPFVPHAPGHRVAQVSVPGNYVAVTFDDGPSSAYTPQVLDILRRHGARATFYVTGRNASHNRSLLARAVAEGHEIGNHTYSHIKMTASGNSTIAREVERTSEIIRDATGFYPTTMRPPYGAVNSNLVERMYQNYGMHTVLWDVDTRDWQRPGVATVVERAVGKAQPGSIILLHDIHASTLDAVEDIIVGLKARGFKLVTVSQLIAMGNRAAGVSTAPASVSGAAGVSPELPGVEAGLPGAESAVSPSPGEAVIGNPAAPEAAPNPAAASAENLLLL